MPAKPSTIAFSSGAARRDDDGQDGREHGRAYSALRCLSCVFFVCSCVCSPILYVHFLCVALKYVHGDGESPYFGSHLQPAHRRSERARGSWSSRRRMEDKKHGNIVFLL